MKEMVSQLCEPINDEATFGIWFGFAEWITKRPNVGKKPPSSIFFKLSSFFWISRFSFEYPFKLKEIQFDVNFVYFF